MDRRKAIQNATLIAMLGLIDIKSLFAKGKKSTSEIRGFHTFKLGKLDITIVTDGHILMKPIQPNFAPDISPSIVNKVLDDNFGSRAEVDLGINIMIIKSGTSVIMIDAGCGSNFGPNSGWLQENLKNAGLEPAQITDIIISHAHPDHIGGLTDKDGNIVFPNAAVYLSKIEHDFWMSAAPDFSKSKIKDEGLKKLVVEVAQKNITALKSRLKLIEDGQEILGCIKIHLAPGHTPGHLVCEVFSGTENLFHLADLVHSAILVIENPSWGFEGDTDFNLAVKSRIRVLNELAGARSRAFSYHLPWPGLGHLRKKNKGFEWLPEQSALPD